ncbi:tRNA-dihydrouridine synthase 1 [Cladophialophora yegresii CBS 114405]|uniref:tRNA-dihydrouridine(16/17) synthase [NAD(P)(+)] n=1 Tax=Cladophialophora yegresii CBS 114405 TaxID=1182544 RepID=W9W1W6_9EURO|nr:tRNA-dihydrouridine synthase 1 [Cladophialophora yegresii CBS 114405]EXJ61933.1 tRNA-dihydrouridine synthase 1 [Cladophialophora yegresii CBS 114405]
MAEISPTGTSNSSPGRLMGRAFYESIGSPKYIVAPMVDRSEFAWRLLTRSYLDEERSKSLLAYTPMIHARLFRESAKYRDEHFMPTRSTLVTKEKSPDVPWLDGNPTLDRPLFVQFCANKPEDLLDAAEYVAPYCDAVDLNLGCPQGIARAGHYGAYLQEDWDTIYKMINKLHNELSVPVTAKMRILDTREKTLEYAKMILSAGASILTVHGRRREQKGHNTGVADWSVIRYLRDNLPSETVIFANGNILNSGDLEASLAATGADGIMSAEGNLSDPTIFAPPPKVYNPRQYWYGPNGKGGYRMDAVFRRYLDIIYRHSLDTEPPARKPLYIGGDPVDISGTPSAMNSEDQNPANKQKPNGKSKKYRSDPNVRAMQGHLFQLLRPLVSVHTEIRDALAKTVLGDIDGFEKVLAMVEVAVRSGLDEYDASRGAKPDVTTTADAVSESGLTPKQRTELKYQRPWWVCQPYIRRLPEEAIQVGAMTVSKKKTAKAQLRERLLGEKQPIRRTDDLKGLGLPLDQPSKELPQPALVCG